MIALYPLCETHPMVQPICIKWIQESKCTNQNDPSIGCYHTMLVISDLVVSHKSFQQHYGIM